MPSGQRTKRRVAAEVRRGSRRTSKQKRNIQKGGYNGYRGEQLPLDHLKLDPDDSYYYVDEDISSKHTPRRLSMGYSEGY